MAAQGIDPEPHPLTPVVRCLDRSGDALDELPQGPLSTADAHALEVAIQEAERQERKLGELRLRLSHAADQSRAAASTGATDTGAWLARLTGSSAAVMRGGLWLTRKLQERYPSERIAFADGDLAEDMRA